jgi:hypothetical protein
MAKDVSVVVDDPPGEPTRQAEATAGSAVDIEAVRPVPTTAGETATVHILVDDVAATRSALANGGLDVRRGRGAIRLDVEDRPGTRTQVAREPAHAAVNVDPPCTTCSAARLAFGLRDFEKRRSGRSEPSARVPHPCLSATEGTR